MNSPTPVLDLLRDPAHWTKRDWAKDKDGNSVLASSPDATCFCLRGAMIKCYPDLHVRDKIYKTKLDPLLPKSYSTWLWFNDSPETTHADVLAILEKAQI